jgi:serine/threonine-protein kinase
VAGGLAEALDYLQKNGVLHRDIKPGNVFLETSGRVVLVDFGLARSQEFTRLTLAGQIVGTFSYMSPERLAGQPVDVAADVFAAGVVFFQMLTGRHPFGAGTPPELMAAIHRGIDWPESFARLERGAELKAILTSMLALDARQRPPPAQIVERVRALRQPRRAGPTRSAAPTRTATESLPPSGDRRAGPTVEVRPAATVLIDAGAPRLSRDPAVTARIDERAVPERSSIERPPLPISTRTAAGGPTWMMFGLAAGSIACLAFTGGLLVGSIAPRPAEQTPPELEVAGGSPETTTDGPEWAGYAALVSGARDAESRGDVDETIRLARAASAVNPADAELHRILGDAFAKSGASTEAVHHYRRYVALRPGAADVDVVRAAIESLSPR